MSLMLKFELNLAMFEFLAEVIVDVYNIRSTADTGMILALISMSQEIMSIFYFESLLCNELKLESKNICNILATASSWHDIRWNCRITFDKTSSSRENHTIEFLAPTILKSSALYVATIGTQRLLNVSFYGLPSYTQEGWEKHWASMHVFNHGISFASQRYYFLGGEVPHKSIKEDKGVVIVSAWFICEELNKRFRDEAILSIHSIRNQFGQLYHLVPSKCNSRVKLGFSPVHLVDCGEKLINVRLIDDVTSSESNAVMTDGCGYISSTLAKYIPYAVQSGQNVEYRVDDKETQDRRDKLPRNEYRLDDQPTPAIVQVRIVAAGDHIPPNTHGLYKGCLIVTDDITLCEPDCIVVRSSMKKSRGFNEEDLFIKKTIIGILQSFEHQEQLGRYPAFSDYKARMNRQLCLLLHHLGVEKSWFQNIVSNEINSLNDALCNREAASRLADEMTMKLQDADEVVDDAEYNFNEALSIITMDPLSLEVKNSLLGRQPLDEPYLQYQLKSLIQMKCERKLKKCLFEVKSAIYLVGAPDPYQELEPGEVFIGFPNDRMKADKASILSKGFKGDVVICKHPINHPGDIQVFKAVHNPKLVAMNLKTNSGIIFFSVKGNRSPADMMSGSDYDGDQFLIFFGQNEILENFKSVAPYCEPAQDINNNTDNSIGMNSNQVIRESRGCSNLGCRECHVDRYGLEIFLSLLRSAQLQYINRYSHAWLQWASIDVTCNEALDCAHLIRTALDASKTGKVVPFRSDLLLGFHAMKSLQRSLDPKSSILDLISSQINDNLVEISATLTIDFDLLMVLGTEDNPTTLPSGTMDFESWDKLNINVYSLFNGQWHEELNFWINAVNVYATAVRTTMKTRCNNTTDSMNQLFMEYAVKFNNMVEVIYQPRLVEPDDNRLFADYNPQPKTNLDRLTIKCRLASIVYLATYTVAYQSILKRKRQGSEHFPIYILQFCWKICGDVLSTNKHAVCQTKLNRSPLKMI